MLINWLSLVIICFTILIGILAGRDYYLGYKSLNSTSIHEAGHCITAWGCSKVTKIIELINYGPYKGGIMRYNYIYSDHDWLDLVITLSGVIAELIYTDKINPIKSSSDLMEAKAIAIKLDQIGSFKCPWDIDESIPVLDFESIYNEPPTKSQIEILDQAYRFGKVYISNRLNFHSQLVKALNKHKKLTEPDIEKILGSRTMTVFVGKLKTCFV